MNRLNDKIKLVIWDLDETYWKGTLSEEGIEYLDDNHELVIELSKRGIINSICSKNDYEEVRSYLEKKGIWEYFVFPEISWDPKGESVKTIISEMALRPNNVLFIDDNLGNVNEVKFFNPGISSCLPDIIPSLLDSEFLQGKDDKELSRLKQYKLLEKKREVRREGNLSNLDFLKESDIRIELLDVDESNFERVLELVERTNQLNYTKIRSDKDELIADIYDENNLSGVIKVNDKYGSYGISGFYLLRDGTLKHFLFSCRTMNMGVENWLYKFLGRPKIEIKGSVATELSDNVETGYIRKFEGLNNKKKVHRIKDKTYLIMGGCDLDQVVHYLSGRNIETEFNFVNDYGVSVHVEHTTLLSNDNFNQLKGVLKSLPIYKGWDFEYKLNNRNWNTLIYSPLNDYSRGIYKHKSTGLLVPFDAFAIDWTDSNNFKDIPKHLETLPKEFFSDFSRDFEYQGAISPAKFYSNMLTLANKYSSRKIYVLTGSEVILNNVSPWESGMEQRHRLMNEQLLRLSQELHNVELIDIRKFVKDKSDHTDNIRHYVKSVYSKIADEIINLESRELGGGIEKRSKIGVSLSKLKNKVSRKLAKAWYI